jgi:hypothetical protein
MKTKKIILTSIIIVILISLGIGFYLRKEVKQPTNVITMSNEVHEICEGFDSEKIQEELFGNSINDLYSELSNCSSNKSELEERIYEIDGGIKKYVLIGFGVVYTENNRITRIEISHPDYFVTYDEFKSIMNAVPDHEYEYSRGVRGVYTAHVWLNKGYMVTTYNSNFDTAVVNAIVRFEPKKYDLDNYKKFFLEEEDTKIQVSMMEL